MFCPQMTQMFTDQNIICEHLRNLRTTSEFSLRAFAPSRETSSATAEQAPPHQQNFRWDNSRTPRTPQLFAAHAAANPGTQETPPQHKQSKWQIYPASKSPQH